MANLTNLNNKFLVTTGGNVGIGTTSPTTLLNTLVTANSENMTLGSAANMGFKVGNTTGNEYGICMGVGNSGRGWIQVGRTDGTATAYDLTLQSSGGNVGIGTTTPASKLDISGDVTISRTGGNYAKLNLLTDGAGGSESLIYFSDTTDGAGRIRYDHNDGSPDEMSFYTASTKRVVINSAGNVGIGTASPSTKLHIEGASAGYLQTIKNTTAGGDYLQMLAETGDAVFQFESGGTGGEATLNMYRDGTQYVKISADAGINNYFNNGANVGIGTTSPSNKFVVAEGTGQHGIELAPGTLSYIQAYDRATSDYGDLKIDAETIQFGTNNGSERMRIASGGEIGVGTTSPTAKLTIDNSIATTYSTTGYAATPANSMLYLNNTNGGSNTASLINFRTGTGDGVVGFVEGGGTNDADFIIQTDGGSNGIERFRITNAGNVTLNSATSLDFQVADFAQIKFRESGAITIDSDNDQSSRNFQFKDGDGSSLMFIGDDGNVGIGTTTPYAFDTTATKFHVKNDSAGSGSVGEVARFEGSSDADGSGGTIRLGTSNDRGIYFEGGRTGSVPYGIIGTTEYNGAKTYSIYLQNTGNVGIGTELPSTKLHVVGANGAVTPSSFSVFDLTVADNAEAAIGILGNSYSSIYLGDAADPNMGAVVYNHSTNALDLRVNGNATAVTVNSDKTTTFAANIHTDVINNKANSANIIYRSGTSTLVGGGSTANKLYVLDNGSIAIGATTTQAQLEVRNSADGSTTAPQFLIYGGASAYGAFHFLDSDAYHIETNSAGRDIEIICNTGGVKLGPGDTAWSSNSDENLKENIKPLNNVLDKIKDYRCVEYNFKDDENKDKKIGFIAQDWQKDFSQVVNKNKQDVLSIKYTETIPVLLKAIQELQAKVKELENK